MDDRSGDPGHKVFGYIAMLVGMVMVLGNLAGYIHGHPPDWLAVGVGSAGFVSGLLWTRRRAP